MISALSTPLYLALSLQPSLPLLPKKLSDPQLQVALTLLPMASTALDGQRYNGQLWTSGEVADKLVGHTLSNFDDFREAFWLAVADTKYIDEFSEMNKIQIRGGNAPFAPSDLRQGEIGRYVLHHRRPIWDTGQVYSIDNLMIASPKLHYEVLPYNYHYNKGLNLDPIGFAKDSNVYTNSYRNRISLIPPI